MMQVVLRELGNARVEMIGKEWMVLLLGLCGDTNDKMIETMKEFLEKMWRARRMNQSGVAVTKAWLRSISKSPVTSRSK
ncbi:hypothetical protein E2C01_087136 [Portunus trituberculatus]|uniref:Uncharacterized protein n=1 Tax=Portunus trituberculatus TaxID=210409 RepID=A0A5B7JI88_PORTR|nr:hypothetical protein [Portunus trituberculatus]